METKDAIFNRRSIRAYQSAPISDADLSEILEAGLMAPSAVNLQPWYFVAIRSPENMKKMTEIMGRVSKVQEPKLKERFANHPAVVEETTAFMRQMGGAPACILAFALRDDYSKANTNIVQSVSAAVQNILLAATDKGIGSCWLTAPIDAEVGGELRDIFAPDNGELVALITLGYPAKEAKAPPRKEGRYIII